MGSCTVPHVEKNTIQNSSHDTELAPKNRTFQKMVARKRHKNWVQMDHTSRHQNRIRNSQVKRDPTRSARTLPECFTRHWNWTFRMHQSNGIAERRWTEARTNSKSSRKASFRQWSHVHTAHRKWLQLKPKHCARDTDWRMEMFTCWKRKGAQCQ